MSLAAFSHDTIYGLTCLRVSNIHHGKHEIAYFVARRF